jgi:hypothetical protein
MCPVFDGTGRVAENAARARHVTGGMRDALDGAMASIRGHLAILRLAGSIAVLAASARVANAADDAPGAPVSSLRQEWVGVELTPVSVALASCCDNHGGNLDRYQAGPGGSIRFGRHRWEQAYLIPFEAGLYVTSGNATILAHLEVEGGVIVPGTDRRFEIGIGTGVGILAMRYNPIQCDGGCYVGGTGWVVSFVARYLFLAGPSMTVGASVRAVVPMSTSAGEMAFGYTSGGGDLLIGGLEVGFGRD